MDSIELIQEESLMFPLEITRILAFSMKRHCPKQVIFCRMWSYGSCHLIKYSILHKERTLFT